jgi:hypothetical protein
VFRINFFVRSNPFEVFVVLREEKKYKIIYEKKKFKCALCANEFELVSFCWRELAKNDTSTGRY